MHFSFMHALSFEQSVFIVHSGRQFGGLPKYCGKQEQEGKSLIFWHCEYGPQGEGAQGFVVTGSTSNTARTINKIIQ